MRYDRKRENKKNKEKHEYGPYFKLKKNPVVDVPPPGFIRLDFSKSYVDDVILGRVTFIKGEGYCGGKSLKETYGKDGVYGKSKRQLNKREIKKLGFS